MNLKYWFVYPAFSFIPAYTFAAAIDISGQPISAFLQEGNYAESSILTVNSDTKGRVLTTVNQVKTDEYSNNINANYTTYNFAIKANLNSDWSMGLIYDKPFGINADYIDPKAAASSAYSFNIDTQELSLLMGYKPSVNSKIYAGSVYQTLKSNFNFSGNIYGYAGNYDADFKENNAFGWLVGAMYKIPEIGFQTDLTYRSRVSHKLSTQENFNFSSIYPMPLTLESKSQIDMPQSVNFNIQTGFFYNTLLIFHTRWVNWKQFQISPEFYKTAVDTLNTFLPNNGSSNSLYAFKKDQWTSIIGLAKPINEKWSGLIYTGLDRGSSLADQNDSTNSYLMGLGLQFNPTPQYFLNGGVIYLHYGTSKNYSSNVYSPQIDTLTQYQANYAMGYALKMGYHF